MKLNTVVLCSALITLLSSVGVDAQPEVSASHAEPADVHLPKLVRSPLWQAVSAQSQPHQPTNTAAAEPARRLTAVQRQELRDQVRRAWMLNAATVSPAAPAAPTVTMQPAHQLAGVGPTKP